MEKQIFRKGDKVFDIRYGWGTIVKYNATQNYPIEVKFDKNDLEELIRYTKYGKDYKLDDAGLLSFTEYDLVNGGFSQERPVNYEDCIGKWGKFWNNYIEKFIITTLDDYFMNDNKPFETNCGFFKHFEPLTEEQIKILGLKL